MGKWAKEMNEQTSKANKHVKIASESLSSEKCKLKQYNNEMSLYAYTSLAKLRKLNDAK